MLNYEIYIFLWPATEEKNTPLGVTVTQLVYTKHLRLEKAATMKLKPGPFPRRGTLGMLYQIHRTILLLKISLHLMDQQGSSWCGSLEWLSEKYDSQVNPVGPLGAKKFGSLVLLHVFNIVCPATLLSPEIQCWTFWAFQSQGLPSIYFSTLAWLLNRTSLATP